MNGTEITVQMKKVNPKYIPREWMLVEVYKNAQNNSFDMIYKLEKLFKNPCNEQPDVDDELFFII